MGSLSMAKGHEGAFKTNECVLYLNYSHVSKPIYNSQYSSNSILKWNLFYVNYTLIELNKSKEMVCS